METTQISSRPFLVTGPPHRHALRALRMYVNGVNDIVNRQEIAFRCRRALLDATGLIAWFGEEVEMRLSERGKRGWRAPEECTDDVGPLGTIVVCAVSL